jgi:hypothetical protein
MEYSVVTIGSDKWSIPVSFYRKVWFVSITWLQMFYYLFRSSILVNHVVINYGEESVHADAGTILHCVSFIVLLD